MTQPESSTYRPLFVNFDEYTDNDPEFKVELSLMIMENLRELLQIVQDVASGQSPYSAYEGIAHKVKSSLVILNDAEFTTLVKELHEVLAGPADLNGQQKLRAFIQINESIIRSLELACQTP